MKRPAVRVAVDSLLFVGFVTVFATREPSFDADYAVHSITGLALLAVLGLHLWANSAWITRVRANGRADREALLGGLNAAFGVITIVCIASGVPLWLDATESGLVEVLHVLTGFGAVVAMVAHVAMSRRRLGRLLRSVRG